MEHNFARLKTTALILFVFAILATSCTSPPRRADAAVASTSRSKNGDWQAAQFTDPLQHKARKKGNPPFQFLVVAILDAKMRYTQHELTEQQAEQKDVTLNLAKSIDLMVVPERIADKPVISSSLIDNEHLQTWGNSGFILVTPDENVFAASPTDLGIDSAMVPGTPAARVQEVLTRTRKKFGKPTPAELLSRTSPKQLNEVGLVGRSPAGKEVKIVGTFVKVDINTGVDLCDKAQAEKIQKISRKNGWPVIRILQPRPVSKKQKGGDSTDFSF